MRETDPNFARKLIDWHRLHGRHDLPWQGTRDPYRIWVSEIMLQQTRVGAVTGYFRRFMDRFPDLQALATATEDDVLRLWSGLGYYARARNLHKAARLVADRHRGRFPRGAQAIAELPGIGRSTAAAVAAFAYGESVAILDGNVKRVLSRRFGVAGYPGASAVEKELWALATSLLPARGGAANIASYTQALMDLGATVCTRGRPACERCPISADCVARTTARISEFPAPRPRKATPIRQATWLLLRHGKRILLERRPSSGLWGGLWVFPEYGGKRIAEHCRREFSCEIANHHALDALAHGFTHFRLEIRPVLCEVRNRAVRAESPGRAWLEVGEARDAALPVPVRKLLLLL